MYHDVPNCKPPIVLLSVKLFLTTNVKPKNISPQNKSTQGDPFMWVNIFIFVAGLNWSSLVFLQDLCRHGGEPPEASLEDYGSYAVPWKWNKNLRPKGCIFWCFMVFQRFLGLQFWWVAPNLLRIFVLFGHNMEWNWKWPNSRFPDLREKMRHMETHRFCNTSVVFTWLYLYTSTVPYTQYTTYIRIIDLEMRSNYTVVYIFSNAPALFRCVLQVGTEVSTSRTYMLRYSSPLRVDEQFGGAGV